jgi:hypothetical protein
MYNPAFPHAVSRLINIMVGKINRPSGRPGTEAALRYNHPAAETDTT